MAEEYVKGAGGRPLRGWGIRREYVKGVGESGKGVGKGGRREEQGSSLRGQEGGAGESIKETGGGARE